MAEELKVSIVAEGGEAAADEIEKVGDAAESVGKKADTAGGFLRGLLTVEVIKAGARVIGDAVSEAWDAVGAYERMGMSLEALVARELVNTDAAEDMTEALGMSSERAEELLQWVEQLAIESPFSQEGVALAFRTALAYSFTTEESQRLTQATLDYAAATGAETDQMGRVVLALGQIQGLGKLAGQEILQLTNAGVPVYDILGRNLGKTTAELRAMQEAGELTADIVVPALLEGLEVYEGAAKTQSTSISGLGESLQDLKSISLRETFGPAFEEVQPILADLVDMLQDPELRESMGELGTKLGEALVPLLEMISEQENIDTLIGAFTLFVEVVGPIAEMTFQPLADLNQFMKDIGETLWGDNSPLGPVRIIVDLLERLNDLGGGAQILKDVMRYGPAGPVVTAGRNVVESGRNAWDLITGGGDEEEPLVYGPELPPGWGNAAGSYSWRGGWTTVGEEGPERVNLPRGSRIHTATESRDMGGGVHNWNITINAPGGDPRAVAGAVEIGVRRAAQAEGLR